MQAVAHSVAEAVRTDRRRERGRLDPVGDRQGVLFHEWAESARGDPGLGRGRVVLVGPYSVGEVLPDARSAAVGAEPQSATGVAEGTANMGVRVGVRVEAARREQQVRPRCRGGNGNDRVTGRGPDGPAAGVCVHTVGHSVTLTVGADRCLVLGRRILIGHGEDVLVRQQPRTCRIQAGVATVRGVVRPDDEVATVGGGGGVGEIGCHDRGSGDRSAGTDLEHGAPR